MNTKTAEPNAALWIELTETIRERDKYKKHAERLAQELRNILKHGSAGNEHLIRATLAQWEKSQQ